MQTHAASSYALLKIASGQTITVRVPATSANLGPGFDVLGLALNVHDEIRLETTDDAAVSVRVQGEGSASLPTDETHLVARTIREFWAAEGCEPTGFVLTAHNVIPHGRGMGSSAAAIVSALWAANAALPEDRQLETVELFQRAAILEGHPDNVAPAVFGGLTISWQEDIESFGTVRAKLSEDLVPVLMVPDVELSTHRARGLLPASVPHSVAASNGGRVGLLVHALASDLTLLHMATADQLHQDFRAEAMPDSAALIAELRELGYAAVVSGAGPTVMVMCSSQSVAEEVARRVEGREGWRVLVTSVDENGVRVEEQ
ncbi:homoserine kinase [Neomicrococcus aestuarii]|uniref:Homoserine kinase n=1 Tax=Neomicrococcus aestuarii TaxID=556325 RepID=A0A7W8X156_9MICC|nr:homoserine kinase [Neomicrococcus aestuarii]MBB5513907.1 homoserine kinase [Neomicrococcus aestuarii]